MDEDIEREMEEMLRVSESESESELEREEEYDEIMERIE